MEFNIIGLVVGVPFLVIMLGVYVFTRSNSNA